MSGINEAFSRSAKLYLSQEIEKFRGLPVNSIRYELFGAIEGFNSIGLLKSNEVSRFRNEIQKIKPWDGEKNG